MIGKNYHGWYDLGAPEEEEEDDDDVEDEDDEEEAAESAEKRPLVAPSLSVTAT
eukprot:CAMPEP_0206122270 /NCGR_PEP_ID=MMETSP1472-20131121/2018_1 /ASSEMBLY_ACC=CAM_ASM_001108 /TAXON_ID=41880 /ORGANISM="Pycnococcus provasolii, Strain RCC251" /LENGTH=53 /DNA_ID=CAMNT_0053512741 /DNA_START=301 /DNA_END=463 /DNA_ORIENTATION=+